MAIITAESFTTSHHHPCNRNQCCPGFGYCWTAAPIYEIAGTSTLYSIYTLYSDMWNILLSPIDCILCIVLASIQLKYRHSHIGYYKLYSVCFKFFCLHTFYQVLNTIHICTGLPLSLCSIQKAIHSSLWIVCILYFVEDRYNKRAIWCWDQY